MDRKAKLLHLIQSRFGGNQANFAGAIKRSPAQVNQWLTGHRAIGDGGARIIELALDLPPGYFDGVRTAPSGKPSDLVNTEPGPDIRGAVPLISWVQAGAWSEIVDTLAPRDAEEWLPCPVKHGARTFVLRVRGESMWNPHARPSFHDGDLIFVDPDRDAVHGSMVVVRLDADKEATFKQLVIEGSRRFLRAANPAWPAPIMEIDGEATICGVVIFKGEKV